MIVKIKCTAPGILPKRQTSGSAGYDLYSAQETVIQPKECGLVKTGIILEIPEGFEGQIRSRSGLAAKNQIMVLNSPGTIDSDYRNEISVLLMNFSSEPFKIEVGSRIAQIVFAKIWTPIFEEISECSKSDRSGGWGSTGTK